MGGSVKELVQWIDLHPLNPTTKESMSDFLNNKWSFAVKDDTTNMEVCNGI